MEISENPCEEMIIFSRKLKNSFSDEEIASFILSLLGMCNISSRFIFEEVRKFMEIPHEGYGVDQNGTTTLVNCSLVNEYYEPVNKTIRMEI